LETQRFPTAKLVKLESILLLFWLWLRFEGTQDKYKGNGKVKMDSSFRWNDDG